MALAAAPARADYTFTKLAETGERFDFVGAVSIKARGDVVVAGGGGIISDEGVPLGTEGLYLTDEGGLRPAAEGLPLFTLGLHPRMLNNRGEVALYDERA